MQQEGSEPGRVGPEWATIAYRPTSRVLHYFPDGQ